VYGNVYHQGTVYFVTSVVVLILLTLLADPSTPDRSCTERSRGAIIAPNTSPESVQTRSRSDRSSGFLLKCS
jgi:hypothetical protein